MGSTSSMGLINSYCIFFFFFFFLIKDKVRGTTSTTGTNLGLFLELRR